MNKITEALSRYVNHQMKIGTATDRTLFSAPLSTLEAIRSSLHAPSPSDSDTERNTPRGSSSPERGSKY